MRPIFTAPTRKSTKCQDGYQWRVACNLGYLAQFLTIVFHSTRENVLIAVMMLSLLRVQSVGCKKTYGANVPDSRQLGSMIIGNFITILLKNLASATCRIKVWTVSTIEGTRVTSTEVIMRSIISIFCDCF